MRRSLIVAVLAALITSLAPAADADQVKALEKYAAQWDWKQTKDDFLKGNKDAAGNELPGSDKALGYLLLPADRCASTDHELEAHGFLGGDKVLVRCLVDEQAVKAAGGNGEGQTYLGFILVEMDRSSTVAFRKGLATPSVHLGDVITATATDQGVNTSGFSAAVAVE